MRFILSTATPDAGMEDQLLIAAKVRIMGAWGKGMWMGMVLLNGVVIAFLINASDYGYSANYVHFG